ncbi:MAG: nickel-responsive transcriptional regulator NikR [Acidisphaera sp.]|nr:nickel-responsive transcriptional regulator NikR [Acidisphaera sp.]
MQRVTITIEDELLAELDGLVAQRGNQNRSEALRDLVRAGLHRPDSVPSDAPCVAALVYVYDHARRDLPRRLTHEFHNHHDLAVSTLHVHLDRGQCLEVAVLRGAAGAVRHMADHVIAERGVRHGQLVVLPSEPPGRP